MRRPSIPTRRGSIYQAFQTKWTEFHQGTLPLRAFILDGKYDEADCSGQVARPTGQ